MKCSNNFASGAGRPLRIPLFPSNGESRFRFDKDHVMWRLDRRAVKLHFRPIGYLSDDDSKFHKYWPADLHLVERKSYGSINDHLAGRS